MNSSLPSLSSEEFGGGAGRSLNVDQIIASARTDTGFEDLADPTLASRLADLGDQLTLRLDGPGQSQAAAVIHGLLVQRLEVFEARRRLPIASESVERPIIAMGEARSGTTVLQMLLGCDPASRLLEFWEVMRPSPPPGISDSAERRRQGDEDWREILTLIPRWLISHPYNAMLGRNPPECERLWAFDFRAVPPSAWWRVPVASWEIRLPQEPERQYEIHKMMLQHLQHGRPSRRWVLKGVQHQHRLAAVLDAYPDAIFVWIHRDPLQAIASRFELQAQSFEGIAGSVDRAAFASALVERSAAQFLEAARTPLAADPRIHHLLYRDVTADPVATIRALYDMEDLEFTETFDTAMRTWLAENPAGRYGRFTYSAEALGADLRGLDERLDVYRDRFEVPREQPRD